MSDSVKREIEVFKRKMLADRLAKCTEKGGFLQSDIS